MEMNDLELIFLDCVERIFIRAKRLDCFRYIPDLQEYGDDDYDYDEIAIDTIMATREKELRKIMVRIPKRVELIRHISEFARQSNRWDLQRYSACVVDLALKSIFLHTRYNSFKSEIDWSTKVGWNNLKDCLELPGFEGASLVAPIYNSGLSTSCFKISESFVIRHPLLIDECRLRAQIWVRENIPMFEDFGGREFPISVRYPQYPSRWKDRYFKTTAMVAELHIKNDEFEIPQKKEGEDTLLFWDRERLEWNRTLIQLATKIVNLCRCLRSYNAGMTNIHLVSVFIEKESPFLVDTSTGEKQAFYTEEKIWIDDIHSEFISDGIVSYPQVSELDSFLTYWILFEKTINGSEQYLRAIRRYENALVIEDLEDRFAYLVLALEALIPGSIQDIQYRVAVLLTSDLEYRKTIYDFMALVYKRRNRVMHGGGAFEKSFFTDFNKLFKTDITENEMKVSWFVGRLLEIVRQCLRYIGLYKKYTDKKRDDWGKELTGCGLLGKSNETLLGVLPDWVSIANPLNHFRNQKDSTQSG